MIFYLSTKREELTRLHRIQEHQDNNSPSRFEHLISIIGVCQNVPRSGLNPMFLQSAENGNLKMLACLLEFGADVNTKSWDGYTALIKASINGNTNLIDFLIKSGADINATTKHGFTALLYAAKIGHHSVIQLLVTEGADVNVKDRTGMTPLMYLARNGYIKIVTNLISEDLDEKLTSSTINSSVEGDYNVYAYTLVS